MEMEVYERPIRYSIHESNIERMRTKIATVQKKCKKYGCDFFYREVGEEIKSVKNEDGYISNQRFIIVETKGIAQMNDWQFVAEICHEENGNVIRKAIDIEVPKRYYNCSPKCEHCKTDRPRKDTYLVRNLKTGEFNQVGRSCLKDFTHGMDAQAIAFFVSIYEALEASERCGFGRETEFFDIETLLMYTTELVKHFGYHRSDDEDNSPTKHEVLYFMAMLGDYDMHLSKELRRSISRKIEKCGFNPKTDENKKHVADMIAWLEKQPHDTDYMHNLKVIVDGNDYVTAKNIGFLVSLVPTYAKAMERIAERKRKQKDDANSCYLGNVGEKITAQIKDCSFVRAFESMYGNSYLYKFHDVNGNVLMWFASKQIGETKCKSIVGTVKEHKDFNGIKQTILTRCKVC